MQIASGGSAGYAITHAGRQIRFGPVAFWIAVGTVVIMAGWSLTAATYFAFRDDVLRGLLARQAEQQYAYEDRIAELRARLDRTTEGQQVLDQEQFEQKLEDLLRRQGTLESRASALTGMTDPTTTGSIRPTTRGGSRGDNENAVRSRPPVVLRPQLDADRTPSRQGRRHRGKTRARERRWSASNDANPPRRLRKFRNATKAKPRTWLRNVFADLGLKVNAPPMAGSGGPFVPVKLPGEGNGFERELTRLALGARKPSNSIVPWCLFRYAKPVNGRRSTSPPNLACASVDPFLRIPAMHTGLDFRGESRRSDSRHRGEDGHRGGLDRRLRQDGGDRSTATWSFPTRYPAISRRSRSLSAATRIRIVPDRRPPRLDRTLDPARMCFSTETRIDGEPVDPQKFLNAGARLEGASTQ